MSDAIIRCPECGRRNRVPAAAAGKPQCGQCHKPLPWIIDATDETDPVTNDMVIAILRDEEGHRRLFEGYLREYEAEGKA